MFGLNVLLAIQILKQIMYVKKDARRANETTGQLGFRAIIIIAMVLI